MGFYWVWLTRKQEKFLDLYLTVKPLRPEHKRRHYPGLVAKNFINSMMAREEKYKELYRQATGEEWKG